MRHVAINFFAAELKLIRARCWARDFEKLISRDVIIEKLTTIVN